MATRRRMRSALAFGAIMAVLAPAGFSMSVAQADSLERVKGTTNMVKSWKNYSSVRSVHCLSGRTVTFYPTDLFNSGASSNLQLRLINANATAALSKPYTWTKSHTERALGQYASGTRFRMSAKGWNGVSADNSFSGELRTRTVWSDDPATCG